MDLERLKNIQRVDAPPFLFTRIQEKINAKTTNIRPLWAWSMSVACASLLLLNVFVLLHFEDNAGLKQRNLVEKMHLSSNNQLYNFENE